jgi:hypothetical protein
MTEANPQEKNADVPSTVSKGFKMPTLSPRLPPEPKTSFPVVLRDELLCDVEPVEGCTPLLALACLFAGDEANTSLSLEGFPSRRLPEPVKGVNFGSSSTATSEI